jgi:hypothetical protein
MNWQRFLKDNPGVQSFWNSTRGQDTLAIRVRKKYPNLPTACQARGCNEARVLDFAHRPEFKMNGAWRSIDLYQPHMIWVLCPTCHRVLDEKIETPEQMGLK